MVDAIDANLMEQNAQRTHQTVGGGTNLESNP
jgi:hypothetical protein